ncbi:NUDIX hydrolase [Janthinobacterium psychrotolerans]|uniref:ADP-ribose pyrophosphatase YjhB, NUDIX family n=1 Tax=Janthinobacterium psychrotolerans TaxID=1747903 RepID=A0A1A7C6B9_9BURK|nr:NUDIX hydrolase [Janthinobacterium psychrotolerans]OBV39858.1 ADP-ribose pyrophosphatase YjhB, NUDIX family [Janthinobacterium psychrotolerans]
MRQQIRQEVAAIVPLDQLERSQLADTLAWIAGGDELFRLAKPATPPKHLVAYFVVVDDGHVLLVDHRNAQLWLPPGGHVDPGEHPRTTVLRELAEELGLAPTHAVAAPLMLTVTTTVGLSAGHTDVSLWYVIHADRRQAITWDENEFSGIRWFAFDDVPFGRSEPHLRRFLAKLKALSP